MSALIRQSHANNTDPLWASAQGGENIVTDLLTINQGGGIIMGSSLNNGTQLIFDKALDGSTQSIITEGYLANVGPAQALQVLDENADYDVLQVGDLFVFGKGNASNDPNYVSFNGTGGSFGLSYGTINTRTVYVDKLETGTGVLTSNIIGPVPVNASVGAPYSVAPVPNSPTAPSLFAVPSPAYPTTIGEEYDINAFGEITLASGTADANVPDIMAFALNVGGSPAGNSTFFFNPATAYWNIRTRLICSAGLPNIQLSVQNTNKGTSTAVWDAKIVQMDIVRVK